MEILKMPIVDFLKYSLQSAFSNGFVLIACLIARKGDAPLVYDEVKRHWESFHDITGNEILFVFAGKISERKDERNFQSIIVNTEERVAFSNPSLHFINCDDAYLYSKQQLNFNFDEYYRKQIDITHTQSIIELKKYLNLTERDIPALAFFPTLPLEGMSSILVKLSDMNLYLDLKSIIKQIEPRLRTIHKLIMQFNDTRKILTKLSNNLDNSVMKRFEKSVNFINKSISTTMDEELKIAFQTLLTQKKVTNWHQFDHYTRAFVNRYLDLVRNDDTMEKKYEEFIKCKNEKTDYEKLNDCLKKQIYEHYRSMLDDLIGIQKIRCHIIT